MTIHRVHRKKTNFSMILNEGAWNTELSWAARGLLWYLLTKPQDWEVQTRDLVAQSQREGLKRVKGILAELENAGYVIRWCDRGKHGRMEWHSEVFESQADADEWYEQNQALMATALRLSKGTSSYRPKNTDSEQSQNNHAARIPAESTIYPSGLHGGNAKSNDTAAIPETSAIPPSRMHGQGVHGEFHGNNGTERIPAESTIYPSAIGGHAIHGQGLHGEFQGNNGTGRIPAKSTIYPSAIGGLTMHGEAIGGETMHGQGHSLINKERINTDGQNTDQKNTENLSLSPKGSLSAPAPENPEEREGFASLREEEEISKAAWEEPKTNPSPVKLQHPGVDQFSAAPSHVENAMLNYNGDLPAYRTDWRPGGYNERFVDYTLEKMRQKYGDRSRADAVAALENAERDSLFGRLDAAVRDWQQLELEREASARLRLEAIAAEKLTSIEDMADEIAAFQANLKILGWTNEDAYRHMVLDHGWEENPKAIQGKITRQFNMLVLTDREIKKIHEAIARLVSTKTTCNSGTKRQGA